MQSKFASLGSNGALSMAWAIGLLLSMSSAVYAQSGEIKIGYVNADRILRESQAAKSSQTRLEAEFSKREKELAEIGKKVKQLAERFDKESPTLPESERSRRQRELMDQDRDYQRRQREFQEDLNQRKNEELAAVVERANRVMKQIFDNEKYDIIVQEAVFAGPRVDITDKVIKALNANGGK